MFCTRQATISVLFILLTTEVFRHCSAEDDITPPSVEVYPPDHGGSLPGVGGDPLSFASFLGTPGFSNFNPTNLMGQLASINVAENIPRYTQPIVQVTKTMIDSVNQIREAMGIPEFTPNSPDEPNAENE